MALVASLLDLPKTSSGLQYFGLSVHEQAHDGSASRRRKIARLDTDSDIASRSTSGIPNGGPFVIKIIGDEEVSRPQKTDLQVPITDIGRFIKTVLSGPPGREEAKRLPVTNETVYSTCRTVVNVFEGGPNLYSRVEQELDQAMVQLQKHLVSFPIENESKWIGFFTNCCKWFEAKIALLRSLLTYLDREYVANQSKGILEFRELAYASFSKRVLVPAVRERILKGVQKWLEYERENETEAAERSDVAAMIKYLIAHHQYALFEEQYLKLTDEFYSVEGVNLAEALKDDPKAHFGRIEARIKQEIGRFQAILPVGTWNAVLERTEAALLHKHAKPLAHSLLPLLFKANDIPTLGALYSRLARVKELKALQASFLTYIESEVKAIVTDKDRDEEMVDRLLTLKKLADEALDSAFLAPVDPVANAMTSAAANETKTDKDFSYILSDALSRGFRSRRKKPAEMIAKYLDKQLRKGQKGMKDAEYQEELCRVLPLYRYTDDRDVFRNFYQRMLAKRLLLSKAASDEIEKWMLQELKEHYDPEFGHGQDMFKDLKLSQDLMEQYHEKYPGSSSFNAMILRESAWPFSKSKAAVNLPAHMQEQLSDFHKYFNTTGKKGRVLFWDPALGTVTMKARFKTDTKELSVSLYQALVLLLFNDDDDIAFKDIASATNISDAELRLTLQSLACGKKKVLKKTPAGKDVNDDDIFSFNADFTDPLHRVHINTIQAKVSAEESKRAEISIETDRVHTLEAAIVRIMKSRKELTYQQLSMAAVEAVKAHFNPDRELIKKTIDSLVEREYMERAEGDRNRFSYVA